MKNIKGLWRETTLWCRVLKPIDAETVIALLTDWLQVKYAHAKIYAFMAPLSFKETKFSNFVFNEFSTLPTFYKE